MPRDPQFDILFEPMRIGPKTARNRFYQVPHCSGMGRDHPRALAAMRATKAEGGWAVVNTEYCSIHASSDDSPYPYATLWDDDDVRANAAMVEAVHAHGALAGAELWHGGSYVSNLTSREPAIDVDSRPSVTDPIQSRRMDKADIAALRRWHADAARRAVAAGFDIVYVYATHDYLLHHFLQPATNPRTDEYGGSLVNRVRIVREIIEETRAAVGDKAAVAVRFTGAHTGGPGPDDADLREMLAMLGPLADLWDLVVDDYAMEMGSARFVDEGAQTRRLADLRALVDRPVVAVGRFTTPDAMAALVRKGVVDFIGAARPSIADPFLPAKIERGEAEAIRECIGCNICYASNSRGHPIRCTQNPTMGEEWRRGWHPERIDPAVSDEAVLIVGGGPAGLEAACALGRRGHPVTLAEAGETLGGRVARESALPGLASWARVRDHRLQQLTRLGHVTTYCDSPMDAAAIKEVGCPVVLLATGARWRRDGVGRHHRAPVPGFARSGVFTPDDLMDGDPADLPDGPVTVFDDEHYYMAAVLAEWLRTSGQEVTLLTTAGRAAEWAGNTEEDRLTNKRLLEQGVAIRPNRAAVHFDGAHVVSECIFTGRRESAAAAALVTVTARAPVDDLWHALSADPDGCRAAGIRTVRRIGDCLAPGLIAHAVHAGHRAARELGTPAWDADSITRLPRELAAP